MITDNDKQIIRLSAYIAALEHTVKQLQEQAEVLQHRVDELELEAKPKGK